MTYCIFLKFDEICVSKFPHILEIRWIMQFWPYTKNDVKTWYSHQEGLKCSIGQSSTSSEHKSGIREKSKVSHTVLPCMFVNKQSWLEILGGLLDVFPIGKGGGSVAILVYSKNTQISDFRYPPGNWHIWRVYFSIPAMHCCFLPQTCELSAVGFVSAKISTFHQRFLGPASSGITATEDGENNFLEMYCLQLLCWSHHRKLFKRK